MYTAAGQPDREQLVQRFVPLVKRIAYHLMARLPPSVQFDDLVQNGMLGLLDAMGRYEEGFGAQFETYATQRVRGAMLDGLRENDWLPRNLRREFRRIEAAMNQLEHVHGRAPSERELAEINGNVTFRYKDSKTREQKSAVLPVLVFIAIFLQHVLPKRFRRVRAYGWQSPAAKTKFARIRALLDALPACASPTEPKEAVVICCPKCQKPMRLLGTFGRGPPR